MFSHEESLEARIYWATLLIYKFAYETLNGSLSLYVLTSFKSNSIEYLAILQILNGIS